MVQEKIVILLAGPTASGKSKLAIKPAIVLSTIRATQYHHLDHNTKRMIFADHMIVLTSSAVPMS